MYILIPLCIVSLLFAIYVFFFAGTKGKGALQVTATPKSNVYLNGKLIGQTPLCKCEAADMLDTGDYTLRVTPQDTSLVAFEEKIPINKSVLTVVDRSFGQNGSSQGSIITLSPLSDKKAIELLVVSFPEKAEVLVDNSKAGTTPLILKNVTDSDHELRLTKDGYLEKAVRIRTVKGYKLTAAIYMGITSAPPTPTPTASPSASPTPSATITIQETPTGFLRVRKDPSVTADEVGRVNPGDTFSVLAEQETWFQIKLPSGVLGWVSNQYAIKK